MPWDRPIRSGVKEDDGEFVKSTLSAESHTRFPLQSRHLIGKCEGRAQLWFSSPALQRLLR